MTPNPSPYIPPKPGTVLSLWKGEVVRPWAKRSMTEIATEVAQRHGLTLDDLKGPCRARRIAEPRQEAMYLIAEGTTHSSTTIGKFLGGRDHSTVLHGVKRHRARLFPEMLD